MTLRSATQTALAFACNAFSGGHRSCELYICRGSSISLTADPVVLVINHELGSSVETASRPWMSNITHREQFNEGQSALALCFADSGQFNAPYTSSAQQSLSDSRICAAEKCSEGTSRLAARAAFNLKGPGQALLREVVKSTFEACTASFRICFNVRRPLPPNLDQRTNAEENHQRKIYRPMRQFFDTLEGEAATAVREGVPDIFVLGHKLASGTVLMISIELGSSH